MVKFLKIELIFLGAHTGSMVWKYVKVPHWALQNSRTFRTVKESILKMAAKLPALRER